MERELGRGGMGVVWLVMDETLEHWAALKFLSETVRQDASSLDEMKRETRKSLKLTHPNIIRIHDFVEDSLGAAISMEYVEGLTLGHVRVRRENRCLEVSELASYLLQMCEALEYAHSHARVVHRDLKPANVMVTGEGLVKVADFGISASLSDTVTRLTQHQGVTGTLAYMSPQQALGHRSLPTDDIYSLGAMIYECLTSKPPFYTGNIMHQIDHQVPPSMATRRQDLDITGQIIPDIWEETIAACLAKDPSQRPQSAAELALRLGLSLHAPTTHATQHSSEISPTQLTELSTVTENDLSAAKPRQTYLTPVILATLALLICGALLFHFLKPSPPEPLSPEVSASPSPSTVNPQPENLSPPEPLPSQPSSPSGGLLVNTDPVGAIVRLNENLIALSPATFQEIPPGSYTMTIEKENFETLHIPIEIKVGQVLTPPSYPLRPLELTPPVPYPKQDQTWTNSLGMIFKPAGTPGLLMSVYESRVKDFEHFSQTTGADPSTGVISVASDGWKVRGHSWKNPGFPQEPDSCVVAVSWEDARAFCQWLTRTERAKKIIGPRQFYRLPKDLEWSRAAGLEQEEGSTPESRDAKIKKHYGWGSTWPPGKDSGNFAGSESRDGNEPPAWTVIENFIDSHPRTALVGSYPANLYGLHDLAGNAWEWCDDSYNSKGNWRVLRGGSWGDTDPEVLLLSKRFYIEPGARFVNIGFRCVLVLDGEDEYVPQPKSDSSGERFLGQATPGALP
ncbi:MAG: SUMF1/EgtB/PvdO family nonheme iron enzyme [Blastochloris sp.]|nr:SUMF1/EgtB/PvdO family nonheme iron enzyme [Blastochloris sp.]